MPENKDTKQEVKNNEADEGRREALKKMGKYAYTAPVIMSLLSPRNADAINPPPPPGSP